MNYRDICESNQGLYAALEQLSHDIAFCEQKSLLDEAIQLRNKKASIKGLIDVNLDQMEKIWQAMDIKRPANRIQERTKPTKLEEKIIMSFIHNEDKRESTIADKLHVKPNDVKTTIDKYLRGYYVQVA